MIDVFSALFGRGGIDLPFWTDIVALCFGVLGMGVFNAIVRLPVSAGTNIVKN